MSKLAKLAEFRAVAERLPLGDHGDRCLRDLLVEILDVFTGAAPSGESLALAGVREPAPPPELVGVTARVTEAAPLHLAIGQARPSPHVADPAGEKWLVDLEAADARAEAEAAAAKTQPKTEPKAALTPNGGH